MIDIAGKKFWYFGFSLLVIIPGLVAVVLWGLNLGVDFSGGTLLELKFSQSVSKENLEKTIKTTGVEVASIASTESKTYLVRTKPLDENSRKSIIASSQNKFGNVEQVSIETIGPTIGSELMKKALLAIGVASLAIVLYIALAFRKVPAPASSWRFGICAVGALLHDV